MRTLVTIVVRNVLRNRGRVLITSLAMIVLVAIYVCISSVTRSIRRFVSQHNSETRLVVREKWVAPSRFPIRCVPDIADIQGVDDWTVWHFFAGESGDGTGQVIGFGTRIDNLRQMHPGLETVTSSVMEELESDKTGALVGNALMQRMGWRLGQRFSVNSPVRRTRLSFRIVGAIESEAWAHNFFFREDYYRDASGDDQSVNVMWLSVSGAESAREIAGEIESRYAVSSNPLRVETESAGAARLTESTQKITAITTLISLVILLDMVIIAANSVNLTVHERFSEIAMLKVLGFQPRWILSMLLGEALLLGAVSGLMGALLAFSVASLDWSVTVSYMSYFPVGPSMLLEGPAVGGVVAVIASFPPAWRACRIHVVDALSAP